MDGKSVRCQVSPNILAGTSQIILMFCEFKPLKFPIEISKLYNLQVQKLITNIEVVAHVKFQTFS